MALGDMSAVARTMAAQFPGNATEGLEISGNFRKFPFPWKFPEIWGLKRTPGGTGRRVATHAVRYRSIQGHRPVQVGLSLVSNWVYDFVLWLWDRVRFWYVVVLSAHGTHAVLIVVRESVCCVRMRVRVGLFGCGIGDVHRLRTLVYDFTGDVLNQQVSGMNWSIKTFDYIWLPPIRNIPYPRSD